ncbi:MAG: methyl-accepting chemotaxis protein [Betaproteobacteria bacterium]|nr:methyl-accepting chemotaxis protein [Betaproteobacteria bacterium]
MQRKIEALVRAISVRQRLAIAFVGSSLIILAVGLIGIATLQRSAERSAHIYGIDVVPMDYVSRMSTGVLRTRAGIGESLLAADAGMADRAATVLKEAMEHLAQVEILGAQYAGLITEPEERVLFDRFTAELGAFHAAAQKVADAATAGSRAPAARLLFAEALPASERLREALEALMLHKQQSAGMDNATISADAERATVHSLVVVILSALIATLLGWIIASSIVRPVEALAQAARALSSGRLGVRIDEGGRDELASLARAFNGALVQMGELVQRVTATARTVSIAADASTAHAGQVGGALRRQATEAVDASGKVSGIARTIEANAREAEEAAREAGEASRDATASSEVVLATVGGMQRIADVVHESARSVTALGARTEEIGKIVGTIAGIADQTSLLALNAAIEAARAGEQGRGFAVVADEVRRLAEHTQEAAREIVSTVQGIQAGTTEAVAAIQRGTADVDAGRAAAQSAAEAIRGILGRTARVDEIISAVARTSSEEARAGEAVACAVAAIGDASQASVHAMDELAATALRLGTATHELDALVRCFDLEPVSG